MPIQLQNPYNQRSLTLTTEGLMDGTEKIFRYKNGAYRVVEDNNNYTTNFGYQWNKFAETQVDKASQLNISAIRFLPKQTGIKKTWKEKIYWKLVRERGVFHK